MSRQTEREDFIARLAKAGVSPNDARKLLRYAATLHRLAEASCNGTYPYQPPDHSACHCDECTDEICATDRKAGLCSACRTQERVNALCARLAIEPKVSGDPRGSVLKLRVPGDRGNDWGGEGLMCVP